MRGVVPLNVLVNTYKPIRAPHMLGKLNVRKLFFLDGTGALITAGMLGLVLPQLEEYVGMPTKVLTPLAIIVVFYALYSFTCCTMIKKGGYGFLKAIAIANSLYCVVTLVLVIQLWNTLTTLGIFYFLGEIAIIVVLVKQEWKMTQSN